MDENRINRIAHKFAVSMGYATVAEDIPWNGYRVFQPLMEDDDGGGCTGLPLVILVKNGKAAMSTPQECFDYLDFKISRK